ncbi:MAG: hypothetical protein NZO58_04040, partial [Gemmataceae bacterium]|nr:hypothetical protein [Gemmataceae bacterium]
VPVADFRDDSAVVMYWTPKELGPRKSRVIGFSYGLGNVTAESEKVGLTFGGSFVVHGEISVVALVTDVEQNRTATIEPPPGMTLLPGYEATQQVPPSSGRTPDGRPRPSPVTWRLRAEREGSFVVSVRTSGDNVAARRITIRRVSIF